MLRRSDVRLVAYRKKNNAKVSESLEYLVPELEKIMKPSDFWEDFSESWDVVVSKNKITRIVPEKDEVFINNTCIEIKTKVGLNISYEKIKESLDIRQLNIVEIIEANYLGDTIDWSAYNIDWSVRIDKDSGRIEVYSKKTKQNVVSVKKSPVLKPLAKEFKTETGNLDDLDPELLSKIKSLLKSKEK